MVLKDIIVAFCVFLCIGLTIYLIKDIRRLLRIRKEVREVISRCEEAIKKRVERGY